MKKLTSLQLARLAGGLALSKNGFDIKLLNLKDVSSVCDYFVIASGNADVHVKSIAKSVLTGLAEAGYKPFHTEGSNEGNWIVLDCFDVIVHIFYEPTRQFYALEKLWGDVPVEELSDDSAESA